jgi:hypothetical protein
MNSGCQGRSGFDLQDWKRRYWKPKTISTGATQYIEGTILTVADDVVGNWPQEYGRKIRMVEIDKSLRVKHLRQEMTAKVYA